MTAKSRIAVALLTMSVSGFGAWVASEGFVSAPMIPTKGDRPTIGIGSTFYEDGRPVTMTDPPITRQRAVVLARNLKSKDEKALVASLPADAKLYPEEFDVYTDFIGQYGIGNWRTSTPRREVIAGNYAAACKALLLYKFAAGYDCSTPGNKRCWGVWDRQVQRSAKCMSVQ